MGFRDLMTHFLLRNDYVMISAKNIFFFIFSNFQIVIFQLYRSILPMIWISFESSRPEVMKKVSKVNFKKNFENHQSSLAVRTLNFLSSDL